jgi:hypothetical protein
MILNNQIEIGGTKPVGQKPLYSSVFPTRRVSESRNRDWAENVFPKLIYWNEVKR